MSKQVVDIDAILERTQLTLRLAGKDYTICDISMVKFLALLNPDMNDQNILLTQLSELLGVEKDEFSNLGLRAISISLKKIREWVLGNDNDGDDTKNP